MAFLENIVTSALGSSVFSVVKHLPGLSHAVVDLSGQWDMYDEEPSQAKPVGQATIRNSWMRVVRMNSLRTTERSGESTRRSYESKGTLRARDLILIFEAVDRPEFIRGSLVLHLDNNATTLYGRTVYFDETIKDIHSLPIWFLKVK